jgi:hypothetical protein
MDNTEMAPEEIKYGRLVSTDSVKSPVTGACGHVNEISSCIIGVWLLGYLRNYQLLKKGSDPRSLLLILTSSFLKTCME